MSESEAPSVPNELLSVAQVVQQRVDIFLSAEHEKWSTVDPRLAEAVDYFKTMNQGGGKSLRAAFCYWSWFGANTMGQSTPAASGVVIEDERILDVCAALELLHSFALVHDDVMDDSTLRRGVPTVHRQQSERSVASGWLGEPRRFGESVAILVGNLGHAYSDMFMVSAPPEARALWNTLKVELNLGQYLDIRSAAAGELDFETAKRVAWYKSALYTVCRPMQLGLSVSGASTPEAIEAVARFSGPLGRAFQLRDDLLGLLGDASLLGKPIGEDVREAKPTELLAYALQKADPQQQEVLSLIGTAGLSLSDIGRIAEVIKATGAVGYIEGEIAGLVGSAEEALDEMPYSLAAKQALLSLARFVASREL